MDGWYDRIINVDIDNFIRYYIHSDRIYVSLEFTAPDDLYFVSNSETK